MKGTLFANVDYPSRKKKIQELSEIAVNDGLNQCRQYKASPVNYVTHSLGVYWFDSSIKIIELQM
jgi:hypothetical protein